MQSFTNYYIIASKIVGEQSSCVCGKIFKHFTIKLEHRDRLNPIRPDDSFPYIPYLYVKVI